LLDDVRKDKEGLMEQGVQTDDELCAALDKVPGLFQKAH
jgi:hypothetical protein